MSKIISSTAGGGGGTTTYLDLLRLYHPVAAWMLDGVSAVDDMGNNDGTINGTLTARDPLVTGATNSAGFTEADLSRVSVLDQPRLSPLADAESRQMSIVVAVNLDVLPANGCHLVNKAVTGAYEYSLSINASGVLTFSVWASGGAGIFSANADLTVDDALDVGVTYHLAGVFDYFKQTGDVYINGVEKTGTTSFTTANGAPTKTAAGVFLGRRGDDAGSHLTGRMQGAAIFPYALSTSQVVDLATKVST